MGGLSPTYKWEPIASKSSDRIVEHHIWSQPQPISRAGSDLYSTLWASVAGAIRPIASARRLDGYDPTAEGGHTMRTRRLYANLFQLPH